MIDTRPDPDALLAAIQRNETRQLRGKLKIFLGMAAGVGKTYAMLQDARQLLQAEIDVVVGYVETHQRQETQALVTGMEIVPRKLFDYREAQIEEMDVDAILARQPQTVLVDELAHSNAPGARHLKRYQDVLELLDAGINVLTTVNVQHFESRSDAVRQITGITVHETVPDSLLDIADEVELIDLSPEELRKRLAEGKVYTAERSEVAANHFFRIGNLTALREMALRLTAEHVDHQLQDYMEIKRIAGPWRSRERLLVAVDANPLSERVIRATRRAAYKLEAPWLAATIEKSHPLSAAEQEVLTRHLELARKLGGEVVIGAGDDVVEGLLRIAHQRNVTQLVLGQSALSTWTGWWRRAFAPPSLVERLIERRGDIDLYIVADRVSVRWQRMQKARFARLFQFNSRLSHYGVALLLLILLNLFHFVFLANFGYEVVGLTDLLAVLLIAVYLGRGPALLAATIGALTWNFFFIPPQFTFDIGMPQDVMMFAMYFLTALLTGNLTARLLAKEQQAQQSAEKATALYALTREAASAPGLDEILQTSIRHIARVFNAQIAVTLANGKHLQATASPHSTLQLDEKELSVASWAFDNRQPAGRHTDTLRSARAQHRPILAGSNVLGVLSLHTEDDHRLRVDQELLLDAFVNQLGLLIERKTLDKAAEQTRMLQESERLHTTLLNSISHELRTPITGILGAVSNLQTQPVMQNETQRSELLLNIQDGAERLNRLVANLLDMSRLDSGHLTLKLDWHDIRDLVGVTLQHVERRLANHHLTLDLPAGLPLIRVDFVLIEQVLTNLLDNASNYTPPHSEITLRASMQGQWLVIEVEDEGPGIAPTDLTRIFEKFYRTPGTQSGGTGLGLSICRGIAEAHGGTLSAENRSTGGARLILRLPFQAAPTIESEQPA